MCDLKDLPIVDFSWVTEKSARDANLADRYKEVSKDLVSCLVKRGYAYVKTDKVSKSHADELMKMANRFFSLPNDVKAKYHMKGSFDGKNGYLGIDFERLEEKTRDLFEYRETFNVYDLTVSLGMDDDCPGLENVYYNFFRRCTDLLVLLLRAVAVGLNLENADVFEPMMKRAGTSDSLAMCRILNYPPMEHLSSPNTIRCGAHSDYDFITLNFQDTAGLEMLDRRSDTYVQLPSVEGAIIIQTGYAMEKVTGGLITGTFHRVYPTPESVGRRRQAIAFFGQPDNEVLLKNLLKSPNEEENEKPITSYELATSLYNASFEKKSRD